MTTNKLSLMTRRASLAPTDLVPVVGDGRSWSATVKDIAVAAGPFVPVSEDLIEAAKTATDAANDAQQSAESAAQSTAAIGSGSSADAQALTGDEIMPLSRQNGLLQTTLAKIATFAQKPIADATAPDVGTLSGAENIPVGADGLKKTTTDALAKYALRAGQIGAFNFTPTNLSRWRAALGRVRAGTGTGKLLCIGDSTTRGAWSNGSWSGNAFAKAYPYQLASMLQGAGVSANGEGFMGGGNWNAGTGGAIGYDPRISLNGSWALNNAVKSLGCETFAITSGGGTFSFAPSTPVDTFEIFYASNAGLGSVNVAFNGGATTTTFATSGSAGVGKAVVQTALGMNTLQMTPAGNGAVYIIGINAYASTKHQVSVINAGWVGGLASNIADMSSPWASGQAIPIVAPDLSIIDCSINDWNAPTTAAAYRYYMQQAITQARVSGDVILMSGAPSNTAAASNGKMAEIVGVLYDLAQTNDIPLIDIVSRWVSWGVSNPLGFYGAGEIVHPSGSGYADIAQSAVARLLSV